MKGVPETVSMEVSKAGMWMGVSLKEMTGVATFLYA
jgi:hypothetical protein